MKIIKSKASFRGESFGHKMRWLSYLILSLFMQGIALLVTPILPLFREWRHGWCDNGKYTAESMRLPLWLSWFDTPDNSLLGDARWAAEHSGGYWSMVGWLYRNSLYGFKWTVLSMAVMPEQQVREGSADIGYQGHRYGKLTITQPNGAWQYKIVRPLFGRVFEGNFGWLLDDTSKQQALFMFSPRIKKTTQCKTT